MSAITTEEILNLFKETDRKFQETDHKFQETNRMFMEAREYLREEHRQMREEYRQMREADRQMREADRQMREADRQMRERAQEEERQMRERAQEEERVLTAKMQETDRQIKELGKQIGGLGKKFGGFAEGMSLPALEKLLAERFDMEHINPRMRVRRGQIEAEFDVVAWSNGQKNTAILVEIKSHPREEAIEQLITAMQKFRQFFPEHRGKTLYGLIAGIDWSNAVKRAAQAQGIYTASFTDDALILDTPEDFKAACW